MKTVTVESILKNAASRAGLDGSAIGSLSSTTKTVMVDNLGMHLRDAWEFFDWPDLCRTEQRTVQTGSDDDLYIDLEQSGETAMGEVFAVYYDNPHTHAAPRELNFTLDLDKVRLPSEAPSTVYVHFRLPATEISTTLATALAQAVPQILADYCKFSLTGDLLTEDGQIDKAQIMYQRAESSLVKEMDKIVFQQKQPRRWSARVNQY